VARVCGCPPNTSVALCGVTGGEIRTASHWPDDRIENAPGLWITRPRRVIRQRADARIVRAGAFSIKPFLAAVICARSARLRAHMSNRSFWTTKHVAGASHLIERLARHMCPANQRTLAVPSRGAGTAQTCLRLRATAMSAVCTVCAGAGLGWGPYAAGRGRPLTQSSPSTQGPACPAATVPRYNIRPVG
jgi:hypothetical protein